MHIDTYTALAQHNRYIPVFRSVLADTETPLSTYYKLANQCYSFLLESVHGGETWGRYSIIGMPCERRLEVRGYQVQELAGDECLHTYELDDPLQFIDQYIAQFDVADVPELPSFYGGLVGYFGYDTVRYTEKKLQHSCPTDSLGHADIVLMQAREVLIFDNLAGVLHIVVLADSEQQDAYALAQRRIDVMQNMLHTPFDVPSLHLPQSTPDGLHTQYASSFTEQAYKDSVQKIRDYIVAGDCMQVVLAQRLSRKFCAEPLALYRVLRHLNPSPYMFYLNLDDMHIVGSSPEVLLRAENGLITVRPIAGTRPRGKDRAQDLALEKELLADPKENAEHLMLIDLGRNDVGRVANTGTVKVTEQQIVERYSHVMHIVSNVEGQLRDGLSSLDALRSILPTGTLSGAPKVRAMQIIDELEPVKRGVYGGAVGYINWQGEMDTAIAIRTAVIYQGRLHVQAGAGIVADSDPQTEWQEVINKAQAILKAAAMLETQE